MRYRLLMVLLAWLIAGPILAQQQEQQDQLGLPGDNLNLYAVMKLFQESPTLESFEKSLNDESNQINNLDLNGDNQIDYIRVIDQPNGSIHNIALRVAVSSYEDQDVAVFVVQKLNDGSAQIQLIGDEDLYGANYIIEPATSDNGGTPNPGYMGDRYPTTNVVVEPTTTTVVWSWPIVRVVYMPTYVVWRSPWRWGYYPSYWRPWRPQYWHAYYGYHYHWNYYYYGHFRPWPTPRYAGWHTWYYNGPYRRHSPYYSNRIRTGAFRTTYSRPDLARQGSQAFIRRYPNAPTVNQRLPNFDNRGRPIRPTTQPIARPAVRPNPGTGTRPTQPSVQPARPGPGSGTRPTQPNVQPRPQPRPTEPAVQPRPQPRPTQPAIQPRPQQRPTQPAVQPRPQSRPAQPGAQPRPESRPQPRQTQPIARPHVKPQGR